MRSYANIAFFIMCVSFICGLFTTFEYMNMQINPNQGWITAIQSSSQINMSEQVAETGNIDGTGAVIGTVMAALNLAGTLLYQSTIGFRDIILAVIPPGLINEGYRQGIANTLMLFNVAAYLIMLIEFIRGFKT